MANLGLDFDSTQYEDMSNFSPIPKGEYTAQIIESEYLPTQSKKGHYLKLVFEIIDGAHLERKIWVNLNLDNPSTQAESIAKKEFSTIIRACGKTVVNDTNILHMIPLKIMVDIEPAQGQYREKNKIVYYKLIKQENKLNTGFIMPAKTQMNTDDESAPWD